MKKLPFRNLKIEQSLRNQINSREMQKSVEAMFNQIEEYKEKLPDMVYIDLLENLGKIVLAVKDEDKCHKTFWYNVKYIEHHILMGTKPCPTVNCNCPEHKIYTTITNKLVRVRTQDMVKYPKLQELAMSKDTDFGVRFMQEMEGSVIDFEDVDVEMCARNPRIQGKEDWEPYRHTMMTFIDDKYSHVVPFESLGKTTRGKKRKNQKEVRVGLAKYTMISAEYVPRRKAHLNWLIHDSGAYSMVCLSEREMEDTLNDWEVRGDE